MSKLDELNDHYKALLADWSVAVDEAGFCSYVDIDGDDFPITIDGSRLVLPTMKMLEEANWTDRMVFHPMSEQASTTVSPVTTALKTYIQTTMVSRYTLLLHAMAKLAANPASHKKLGVKRSKFLSGLGKVDETTVKKLNDLLAIEGAKGVESRLIAITQRHGVEGALRATYITYPLRDTAEIAAEDNAGEILGVKMRKQDVKSIAKLLEVFLPEKIETSTNNRTAPYFETLSTAAKSLAESFQTFHDLFAPKAPMVAEIPACKLEWVKDLEDVDTFYKNHHSVVPSLNGTRPKVKSAAKVANLELPDDPGTDDDVEEREEPRRSNRSDRITSGRRRYEDDDVDVDTDRSTPISLEELRRLKRGGGRSRDDRYDDYDDDYDDRRRGRDRGRRMASRGRDRDDRYQESRMGDRRRDSESRAFPAFGNSRRDRDDRGGRRRRRR